MKILFRNAVKLSIIAFTLSVVTITIQLGIMLWSIDTLADDVHARVNGDVKADPGVRCPQGFVCRKCKGVAAPPGMIVMEAPQAFGAVKPSLVFSSLQQRPCSAAPSYYRPRRQGQ